MVVSRGGRAMFSPAGQRITGLMCTAASVVLLTACGGARSSSPHPTHAASPSANARGASTPAASPPAASPPGDVGSVFNLDAAQVQATAAPFLSDGERFTQSKGG